MIRMDPRLRRFFRSFDDRYKRNAVPAVLRAGANPIRSAMRAAFPTGVIRSRFGNRVIDLSETRRSIGTVIKGRHTKYAVVGERVANAGVGHWFEYGTLAHRTKALKRKRKPFAEKLKREGWGIDNNAWAAKAIASVPRSEVLARMSNKARSELRKEILKG